MLTMKTKYALKALALLATVDQAEPMLISDIAEREGIPKKFLELILRELKQHGILDSRKGRGGGYLLRRRPEDINLASIIRILDGPLAPVPCLSQTAYRRCEGCEDERTCGIPPRAERDAPVNAARARGDDARRCGGQGEGSGGGGEAGGQVLHLKRATGSFTSAAGSAIRDEHRASSTASVRGPTHPVVSMPCYASSRL